VSEALPPVSTSFAPLIPEDRLESWAESQRAEGRSIVFTNGCFDLLHPGHVHSIFEAAEHGDVLLVALNSDQSVRELKGPDRPFHDQATRALLVSALRAVSAVTIFAAASSLPTILRVRPDVLAKGGEYTGEEIVGAREVENWGGEVVRLSMVPGMGTTQLLARMRGEPPRGKEER
jgi:D-beta-D-heptose 7-phosphate kinase/D-beta-D-heptose 1-phosphate adenosyltransferase